jgi:hypothetical protein
MLPHQLINIPCTRCFHTVVLLACHSCSQLTQSLTHSTIK